MQVYKSIILARKAMLKFKKEDLLDNNNTTQT